ncbi:cytochrome c oxidase assembly protein subunit 15 [Natronorubrum sediminis]|uniref:Cytochrome c oxidase assembly protein subunit 15 n=1 Tax=Natronorubrum sediminis TaxID=640943 RepID=A0A1H6FU34_9EURY|nr:cytochrome oxidase assembly protein [Natronorubrum sediminis]SEH14317.1 cytochrome c oxidase assembly protein subunit 15 [Natronorubrum sediminis]
MSTDSYTSRPVLRPLIERFGFRHLLVTTLLLVAATILLGVAAKATGSGLACEQNWPLCDAGPYNAFPANMPSFYEWFHRFVAMFAGFAIVATAVASWRLPDIDNRIAGLVVLGAVLTPIQVILGRETVTQYTMDILQLHFWTAVLIFVLFVVATVLVWESQLTATHATASLALGALSLPFHVALSPFALGDITAYGPSLQMAQYAVMLVSIAAVLVAFMIGRRQFGNGQLTALLGFTTALAFVVTFLAREAVNPAYDAVYLASTALLFVFLAISMWRTRIAANSA